MALDQALQKYYEDREEMMLSQGWKDLMADIKEMKSATNVLSIVKTNEDLWFRKGELSMMDWMLGLQEMSQSAFEQLKKDDDETTS